MIAYVEYHEGQKDEALNNINNPLNDFPFINNKEFAYPYIILFQDNVGDSPLSGGVSMIFGYEYNTRDYGAQIALKFTSSLFYFRNKNEDKWSDWKKVSLSSL